LAVVLVKTVRNISVIPVQTGIQVLFFEETKLDSRLRGNDATIEVPRLFDLQKVIQKEQK
jgi:hypothetical protein